jgi:hypothetical protein
MARVVSCGTENSKEKSGGLPISGEPVPRPERRSATDFSPQVTSVMLYWYRRCYYLCREIIIHGATYACHRPECVARHEFGRFVCCIVHCQRDVKLAGFCQDMMLDCFILIRLL